MSDTPLAPTPWPPAGLVDLKEVVKGLGRPADLGAATPAGYRRIAEMIETRPVQIRTEPLRISGWLDGVQRRCVAGRIEHRDLTLAWLAAGSVQNGDIRALEERLALVCSQRDEPHVREKSPTIPVVSLPELMPCDLAGATENWIDATRRMLEAHALERTPVEPGRFVIVDGPLPPSSLRLDAIGVVKSALDTDWITDPRLLPTVGGWRSPALRLPPRHVGDRARLTAFVRLRDATQRHSWGYSLIRVECFEQSGLQVLDAAAAMAVAQRQSMRAADPRREIQLAGMFHAEQVLKARCPAGITVLR